MKDLYSSLNPEQLQAALHREHCLVIATAGSGKSKMLATKAAGLLDQGERVSAVTFSREAALELRDRIVKLATPGCKSRLLVGTFHSIDISMAFPTSHKSEFGRSILGDMRSPFQKPWQIVKEGVRIGYVIRALRESNCKLNVKDATAAIELSKCGGDTSQFEKSTHAMVDVYAGLMTESGHVDFQDIILQTNKALAAGSLTPLPVDHLLVDEFQDTDALQYYWCAHHGKAGTALTVVGDDDQSIYGFRRALGYAGMVQFMEDFRPLQVMLGTNYRCHREILRSAEILISNNTTRIEKQLFAAKGPGGVVSWEAFKDVDKEYAAVAEEAATAMQEGASFAAIARTNDELTGLQAAMVSRGVPYRKTDGRNIFDCPEVQVYAALLRSILEPTANDIDQVLSWAGMETDDSKEIRKLFGSNIRIGSTADFQNSSVSAAGVEIWRGFARKHAAWTKNHADGFLALMNLGIHEWLDDVLQKPGNASILRAAKSMFEVGDRTLSEHLEKMRIAEMNQKTEKDDLSDGHELRAALLTTAHSSKGLERDRVWLVGIQTGTFPSDKCGLDEERRLMFVAMTRARSCLWLSGTKDKKPSVFAYESGILAEK